MLSLIGTLFVGIILGYLARRFTVTRLAGKSVSIVVYVLILLMGIGVGSNRELLSNLSAVGMEAAVLSLSAVAGSVCLGAWVYKKLLAGSAK